MIKLQRDIEDGDFFHLSYKYNKSSRFHYVCSFHIDNLEDLMSKEEFKLISEMELGESREVSVTLEVL